MAFELLDEGAWITVTFSGTMTGADVDAVIRHVLDLEHRLGFAPDRLVDLGPSTAMALGFGDIASLANIRRKTAPANPFRAAVIAHTPAQRGYARMFQTVNDHPAITVAVFDDRASAEAWLKGV